MGNINVSTTKNIIKRLGENFKEKPVLKGVNMDNFIDKLENEIWQQTRNGRDTVYIEVDDLRKLGYHIDSNKSGRVFIDLSILREYIKRYQFKDNLRVDISKCNSKDMTYREFMKELRKIETGKDRDDE